MCSGEGVFWGGFWVIVLLWTLNNLELTMEVTGTQLLRTMEKFSVNQSLVWWMHVWFEDTANIVQTWKLTIALACASWGSDNFWFIVFHSKKAVFLRCSSPMKPNRVGGCLVCRFHRMFQALWAFFLFWFGWLKFLLVLKFSLLVLLLVLLADCISWNVSHWLLQ